MADCPGRRHGCAVQLWVGTGENPKRLPTLEDHCKTCVYARLASCEQTIAALQQSQPAKDQQPSSAATRWPLSTPAWSPSSWSFSESQESAQSESPPRVRFVLGARCGDTRSAVRRTAFGELVWFVGSVVVCHNPRTHGQRLFLGHSRSVTCVALGSECRTRVATGQMGKDGSPVHVLDATTMERMGTVNTKHGVGVSTICFAGRGDSMLVTVGAEKEKTLAIWDWRSGTLIAESVVGQERVYGVCANPSEPTDGGRVRFVTAGEAGHVRFWSLGSKGKLSWVPGDVSFQNDGCLTSVTVAVTSCAYFGPNHSVFGTSQGLVSVFEGASLVCTDAKAHDGIVLSVAQGIEADTFVSGGEDGKVLLWSWSSPSATMTRTRSIDLASFIHTSGSAVRSVDCGNGTLCVGTAGNAVAEVSANGRVLIRLQAPTGEITAMASHPRKPLLAILTSDRSLRIWSLSERTTSLVVMLDETPSAACYSQDSSGSLLAIGLACGGFLVLDSKTLAVVCARRDRSAPVTALRFSPDDTMRLAVASADKFVDLYQWDDQDRTCLSRCALCQGHSFSVSSVDWSEDGMFLMSSAITDAQGTVSAELLYWNSDGRQIAKSETLRDHKWATWSATVGWPISGPWCGIGDSKCPLISCVERSHDGKLVAVGWTDGLVETHNFPWPAKPSEPQHNCVRSNTPLQPHRTLVSSLQFSHDDQTLISSSSDNSLCLWDLH